MNDVIWVFTGALLGWAGFTFMGFSEGRHKFVAMIIGAAGGFVGGKLIAPMFSSPVLPAGSFNMTALVFAVLVGAAFVFVGNYVHNRWEI